MTPNEKTKEPVINLTPKEKAKELVNIFDNIFVEDEDEHYVGTVERITKQCAIKAVDEILHIYANNFIAGVNYWQEVKQELEKP